MPVEIAADKSPPAVVKLPQIGFYFETSDVAAPAVEDVNIQAVREG